MLYLNILYINRKQDMKTEDLIKEIIAISANKNNLSKMDKESFLNDTAGGVVDRVRETITERILQGTNTAARNS